MSPVFRDVVSFVERTRAGLLRAALRTVGLWVGAAVALVLILAWLSSDAGRSGGTPFPLLLDGLLLAGVGLAVIAYRRAEREWLGVNEVTRTIEASCGLADGTLRGSVELARALPDGVSGGLAEAGARDIMVRLRASEAVPEGELGGRVRRWTRRGWAVLAVAVPVFVILALSSPDRTRLALAGLASPVASWTGPSLPALEVTPESREVLRGSDVELIVRAGGRESVTVGWRVAGDVTRTAEVMVEAGLADYTLRAVRARTEFWVEAADGARTARFVLTPIDPLLVSDLTVSVSFPPHTGRFPEEYRGVMPPLDLPEGANLHIEGRASRELADAGLLDEATGERLELLVEGDRFEADWTPRTSGRWSWSFVDRRGQSPELAPDPVQLTLVEDGTPEIEILLPGRDTVLAASGRQPLVIESADDYGVDRIELVVWRISALGERSVPVVQALQLGPSRRALVRPVMDLSGWNLLTGDTVRYFARAVDNNPSPRTALTPEYLLVPPGPSDLRREAQQRLDAAGQELEELADETAEQAEEMRDREREAAAEESQSETRRARSEENRAEFQEREEVRQALEDREEMVARTDSLAAELEAMQRELEELADPELQESLAELQRLMDEMTPEDVRERLQEMMDGVESMEREEMDDAFREMAEDSESMRDQMEEALERLRQAALEQEFRATGQEAEELARQEAALSDAMAEGDRPQRRVEQQAAIEERAEALEERLRELSEELGEPGDEERREAVERGMQRGNEAQQSMKQAREQAERGEMEEAAESAREAARRMQEMADEMQQAQDQANQEMMDALEQAYRQTSNDALALAREQASLREQMRGASQEELAGMRADEAALLEGVERMSENLAVMNRLTQNDGREISERMGEAMQALDETISALEDQRGRTPSPFTAAENSIQSLNEVAMTALKNAEQLGEGGEGQSQAEQMMEQMQQLAQQQQQVNEQTSQMTPMELGEQAMEQQMEQAAQSQQQVADELGEMSEENDPDSQSLGDVEQMAQEAEMLAEMLQGGRLDAQLRDRQQRLFHRLLDAGRSLERDEETEERESERPGEFEPGAVLPLSAEDLGAFRFRTPDAEELRTLSPAERLMVLQYFERLNRDRRARQGGGGGGR